ncbi:MAG: DNA replication/repair protein RecF [Lachnospira sp.]
MVIESVDLKNFRNYEILNMEFDPHVNIIYGDNAQGKTNILESLYICSTSKSHRGSKDKEIIRFGEEESHIKLNVNKNNSNYRIDMHLKNNKPKGIAVNGIPIKKAVELFGIINIVFFSPEDLNIIKNGPSERRRFVDMELSQLDKIYLNNLVNYNKVLVQRNKLLKDLSFNQRKDDYDTLDVWDMQLVRFGTEIIRGREKFIDSINGIIKDIHSKLTGNVEKLEVEYAPYVDISEFEKEVYNSREKDIKYKMTNTGPHKDDLIFYINGKEVRKYGSQGQKRTAALSLKLSEIELVKSIIKDTPVLLLDDVLSELDANRQKFLLDSIGNIQTIVTCTGMEEFINNRINVDKLFKVTSGKVEKEN